MAFSGLAVLGVLIGAVALLVIGVTPLLAVPVALLFGLALAVFWLGPRAKDRRVAQGPGPTGVPSTRQASYDPVREP